jgi:hypothetical protein
MNKISTLLSPVFSGLIKEAKAIWTVLIFLSLLFSHYEVFAKEPIGTIIAAIGKVKAIDSSKSEKYLKRGDAIYSLDTIIVEAASKAQLKFTDGSLMNLIENTELRVDSYVFRDSNEKSKMVSSLVKGGFRALSGAIAKETPSASEVRTAVASCFSK